MALSLSKIIEHLRPGTTAGVDFDVMKRAGGEEEFIPSSWRAAGVPPTNDEIEAGRVAATAALHVQAVKAERTRRLAAGFDFDFGDSRGVHRIGTTEADIAGWREVTDYADALHRAGHTSTLIAIVTDTGPCQVTAAEWNGILLAAAAFRQPIWAASFALQAMDPTPAGYADDAWWS